MAMPDVPESIKDCVFLTAEEYHTWTKTVIEWMRAESREFETFRELHERRLKNMVLEIKSSRELIRSRLRNSAVVVDGKPSVGASRRAAGAVAAKLGHASTLLMNTVRQLNRGLDSVLEAGGDVHAAYALFARDFQGEIITTKNSRQSRSRQGMDMGNSRRRAA